MNILIKGGTVVDPANGIKEKKDVLIKNRTISAVAQNIKADSKTRVIDAVDKLVLPGFVDMHTHLREPGREDEETLETGAMAAAHGGFTTIVCMPNTTPPVDNAGIIDFLLTRAKNSACVHIHPTGTITRNRLGEELSDIGELSHSGAVAITDDGDPVSNAELMRRALEYAKMFNIPVISHCEDKTLSDRGVMNEGSISTVLGLDGIPHTAEEIMVARDILLATLTKSRVHIAHTSTAGSVELIRKAKKTGVNVTAETAPHYFCLTDENLKTFNTNFKVNPPLRTQEDLEAIIEGLSDGTIDAIATDHAPHTITEKELEFAIAPSGIIGLETSFPLLITKLVATGKLPLETAVAKITVNPARILGLNAGTLSPGARADITIASYTAQRIHDKYFSKSSNSPFTGMTLQGVVETVLVEGNTVLENGILRWNKKS